MEKNKLTNEQKHSIKIRTLTAVVLVAFLVPAIIFGSIYFVALSAIIAVAFAYESVHITDLKGKTRTIAFIVIIILLLATCYYVILKNYFEAVKDADHIEFNNFFTAEFPGVQLSSMLLLSTAATLFVISFFSREFTIRYVFYFLSMIIILSLGLQSLLFLRFTPFMKFEAVGTIITDDAFVYGQSLELIAYVIVGVCANDIGAFFVGLNFGKHKMAPEISPKKTWEGAIGGIVISFAITFAFAMTMAAVGYPLLPQFDLDHWYVLMIISLFIPFFGDIGDFFFSSIKRSFGVKDFSAILPGHGGVLDRLDSLIFASGFVSGMIVLIEMIEKFTA